MSTQWEQFSLLTTVQRNLRDHRLVPFAPDNRSVSLVIGVSGGADSVCLLHALYRLSTELRLDIHVAHLDHGLRPESLEDAESVASLCRQMALPYHESRLDAGTLARSTGNLEENARHARYAFLCRIAGQVANNEKGQDSVPILAVAHNIEDQAETLLLNLVRGSGLRGLGGMRWKSEVAMPAGPAANPASQSKPVRLIRPLLNLHRSEIEEYLTQQGLAWREDSSNRDVRFSRNFLRHRILPELAAINPKVVDTLARTAQIVSDDVDRLSRFDTDLLNEFAPTTAAENSPKRIIIDYDRFADLNPADQRGLLRAAIHRLPGGLNGLDMASFERMLEELRGKSTADRTPPTSGPHPLIGALTWSFVSATRSAERQEPARLIVHTDDVLPVSPWGPQLAPDWTAVELPESGELRIDGWRLRIDRLAVSALPVDWRRSSPWRAWLDAERAGRPALCRPANGMRVAPLGMAGKTRPLGDLFTDEKIHPTLRSGWPLLLDTSERQTDEYRILWVCGLRLGHGARITDRTSLVLALAWEPI